MVPLSDSPEQPAKPESSARSSRTPSTDESIKETFESIIIAFVLAFVFRAYVVEAFVIPTGSMAPTLLGAHLPVTCDQCGYDFEVGLDVSDASTTVQITANATVCPMCQNRMPIPLSHTGQASSGDRILVQKYMYSVVEPRRWDVVVFKAPHEPQTNYIKRLVGLPQERVHIIEGNVYVQALDENNEPVGDWRIARKTDPKVNPHAQTIQRTVWQPLYHSQYVPLDAGERRWQAPWRVESGDWTGVGPGQSPRRSYHLDDVTGGRLVFDFNRAINNPPGLHPYNQARAYGLGLHLFLEDVRIAAGFQPHDSQLSIELQTTGRIDASNEPVTLLGRIGPDGSTSIGRLDDEGTYHAFRTGSIAPGRPGATRQVELWFVDQELSLWVDGELALEPMRFDIPYEAVVERPTLTQHPEVAISVSGSPVTLHRVEVDRDLYYISRRFPDHRRATLYKEGHSASDNEPVEVLADQFFCLGDNSPASHDGRSWERVDPWVAHDKFTNEPQAGIVPRRLMMGRAFFVYYPAAYGWSPQGRKIIPNFGDMRVIH